MLTGFSNLFGTEFRTPEQTRPNLSKSGQTLEFELQDRSSGGFAKLTRLGTDAYIAAKQAELAPKIDAIVAEARARQKNKKSCVGIGISNHSASASPFENAICGNWRPRAFADF